MGVTGVQSQYLGIGFIAGQGQCQGGSSDHQGASSASQIHTLLHFIDVVLSSLFPSGVPTSLASLGPLMIHVGLQALGGLKPRTGPGVGGRAAEHPGEQVTGTHTLHTHNDTQML